MESAGKEAERMESIMDAKSEIVSPTDVMIMICESSIDSDLKEKGHA